MHTSVGAHNEKTSGNGLHPTPGGALCTIDTPSTPLASPLTDHAVAPPDTPPPSAVHKHNPPPPMPPTSISSFPFTDLRTPVASVSPDSPPNQPSSPFRSPFATPQRPAPQASPVPASSPWAMLAAMSGAHTPTVEFPPGARDSPQLGRPFEQLNLGGAPRSLSLNLDDKSFGNSSSATVTMTETASAPRRHPVPSGPISGASFTAALAASSLAARRASLPNGSFNLTSGGGLSSSPLASGQASSSSSPSRLKPMCVNKLASFLAAERTLVLDVRTPSLFQESHLPSAHSLSMPSTLLRRPTFEISKLLQNLSPTAREAVSRWREMDDIILVDQDSSSAPELGVLHGLASKFEREGFAGKLWFIRGGHAAIDDGKEIELVTGESETDDGRSTTSAIPPLLNTGRLPRLAFEQGSTQSFGDGAVTAGPMVRSNPFNALPHTVAGPARPTQPRPSRYGDSLSSSSRTRLQPANLFFDNIRQNIELSHGGITERIPLGLGPEVVRRADELPPFLRDLVKMPDKECMDLLANQFYRIERGEQKRLQSVMDTLAKDSCGEARTAAEVERLLAEDKERTSYFPFSITAGVERGSKNRYKNIWPYDFARVRLNSFTDDDSDYINASFVQPRGTTRRYIATQGPLATTFRDFWTLVWEQGVQVIVMLTKQSEGGLIKCGNYWCEAQYGDLRLQLVSQTGGDDKVEPAATGFDFGAASHPPPTDSASSGSIKRVFHLSHARHPDQLPRVITQVQCVSWPDFDVPEVPDVLLDLMGDIDGVIANQCACAEGDDRCTVPPVLVHCSAGVGRTGSYILVDAIADGLRRERRLALGMSGPVQSRKALVRQNKPLSFVMPKSEDLSFPLARPSEERSNPMDVDSVSHATVTTVSSTDTASQAVDSSRPRPVTQSDAVHDLPTPLSAMHEPIVEVLEGMRVQRMSLVQSLRQYVFVHRAIITHYLAMIDKESRRQRGMSASTPDSSVDHGSRRSLAESTPSASVTGIDEPPPLPRRSTTESSIGTGDESHPKRKPSTADLEADIRLHDQAINELRLGEGDGSVGLSKRASFKKRRGPNDGESGRPLARSDQAKPPLRVRGSLGGS